MKTFFIIIFSFFMIGLYGVTIWTEDFNSYPDGTTTSSKWSISGTNGTFEINSHQFDGSNVANPGRTWTSETIDLTSYDNSSIELTVDLGAYHTSGTGFEASDYLYVYYSIDGGSNTFFDTNGNNSDDTWAPTRIASQSGLPAGNNLEIIIVLINSEAPEHYTFDNVLVEGNLESGVSVSGRVWYDNNEDKDIDSGELGIGSVTVELYSDHTLMNLIDQTITASNGDYTFSGVVENSTYYVYCDEQTMGGSDVYSRTTTSNPETVVVGTVDVTKINFGYVWTDDCMPTMFFNYDAAGNKINAGDFLDEQFAAWGIHISTNDPANHNTMAFDSGHPTGGDFDLGTPNEYWINDGSRQWLASDPDSIRGPGVGADGGPNGLGPNRYPLGNLIVISNDNNQSDPNDYAGGGVITFDFDQPMRIYEVTLIDDHDPQGGDVVTTYDSTYTAIGHYSLPDLGENSFQVARIDDYNVKRMEFTLQGSGAMSGVRFCPEETPLSVTLSSFTAQYINYEVSLNWQTQSEKNNSHWNVYRSISENIGQAIKINAEPIIGAGTTSIATDYIYHDESELFDNAHYRYWLESVSFSGNSEMMGHIDLVTDDGIDNPDAPQLGEEFGLFKNSPNPFNPVTKFSFRLKEPQHVSLSVYNLKGQLIATVFDDYIIDDSMHYVSWSLNNNKGLEIPSGIYLYQLKGVKFVETKKMIVVK